MPREQVTYEEEVLRVLAFEFSRADRAEAERKIKRRLREKKLGAYDQRRIDTARAFKNEVQKELGKCQRSRFYVHPRGKYADMQDWDFDALLQHLETTHPDIPAATIGAFLPYAIYLYYLR